MYSKYIEKIVTNPKSFRFLGFTVIRSVLTMEEVAEIRRRSIEWFEKYKPPRGNMLLPRHILQIKELYNLPFKEKVVRNLKLILGDDYVYWGDFQLQRNSFGGWHVDSGSENMKQYLFAKNYCFAKCGIYLQENSAEWGGGIGVRLFSHKIYNSAPHLIRMCMVRGYKLIKNMLSHYIVIHPGDFVCFDSRLEHSSRFPADISVGDVSKYNIYPLPEEHAKYVFYFNACNKESVADFMTNSLTRGYFEEVLPKSEEAYFVDYTSRDFPNDYPKDFSEKIKLHGLSVATPSKRAVEVNKQFLKELCEHETI